MAKGQSVLRSGLLNILALSVLFAVSQFFLTEVRVYLVELAGAALALAVAGLVTAVWVSAWWLLDRVQPEPLHMVLYAVFVGVVAWAAAVPFLGGAVAAFAAWPADDAASAAVLWVARSALLPAGCLYLALRVLVMPGRHFNELVDGLIYGGIVGTGYALASSMGEVAGLGAVNLHFLVLTLITRLSMYSALGALCGYFFGHARMDPRRRPVFLVCAAALSALLFWGQAALEQVVQFDLLLSSLDVARFLLALGVTALTVVFAMALVRLTLAQSPEARPADSGGAVRHLDAPTLAVVAVLLAAAVGGRAFAERGVDFASPDGQWTFRLPAGSAAVAALPGGGDPAALGLAGDAAGASPARYEWRRGEDGRRWVFELGMAPADPVEALPLPQAAQARVSRDEGGRELLDFAAGLEGTRVTLRVTAPGGDRVAAELAAHRLLVSLGRAKP